MAYHADAPHRCSDCFHEFRRDEDRFVILAKRRDVPADWNGSCEALSFAQTACFDQVFICADCAGWYGDHPIPVTADEALGI